MSAAQRRDLAEMRDFILKAFPGMVLDFWSPIATRSGKIKRMYDSGDGVHLNDAGHRQLFDVVRNAHIPERLRVPRRVPDASAIPTLRILPYPARDFVAFRIGTGHRNAYRIRIMNIGGNELQRLSGKSISGYALRYYATAGLPRGIYRVELRCGSTVITKPMVLR
jgi:hypothetical protein